MRLAAAACALALLAPSWPAVAAEDAAQQLDAVVRELNALDEWLDSAGKRLADQQRELAAADRAVADLLRRSRTVAGRIDAARGALADLEAQREELAAQRDAQADRIAGHLRDSWRFAGDDFVKLWLNQEDPIALERMVRYHGYFVAARVDAVAELADTIAGLAANAGRLESEQEALRAAQAELERHGRTLEAERSKRALRIAGLESEVSAKGRERERLASDRRRLESLLAELRRKRAGGTERVPPPRVARAGADATPAAKGAMRWPVEGEVVRRFGQARAGGRMRWEGVYINAPLGADVYAAADGEVVFADWLRGFGMLTIVDHGGDRLSLYGHSDALYKGVGDSVQGGDVIASVGQSGGEGEVGLYFEIREGGDPTDPLPWLRRR